MTGTKRENIKLGLKWKLSKSKTSVQEKLTEGVVANIHTNSGTHPHGMKVRLENGVVGRVKEILDWMKNIAIIISLLLFLIGCSHINEEKQ